MLKVLWFRFQNCLGRFSCCFSNCLQKCDFLDIYLTTVSRIRNFENTSAMRFIFFWKFSKFNLNVKNAEKAWEKVIPVRDKFFWIGCVKLSLLRREYLLPAVNVLKNSPNFLSITKRNFFELKLPSEWSINIVKVLSFRFQHCLIPCTMLLVKGFSEMRLFRH